MTRLGEMRGAIVSLLLVVIVVGVTQLVGRPPQHAINEPGVFALSPQGDEVPRLAPITVTFAKEPAEKTPDLLVQVQPDTKGTFAWMSPRTLLFQPEFPGLLRGSTYTVNIPARPEAGLPQPVTKTFTVTGNLAVQQVIPGDGDTEVPLGAQILVQFSRSVAPLTTLSAQSKDQVVTFDPPLKGKGEWLNTSIYRFVPADLIPSTTYRLKIAKGLSSTADGVLGADFTSTFSTVVPAVATVTPDDNAVFAGPFQEIVITFNQPMDASAASGVGVRNAATGAAVPVRQTWNADHSILTLNPTARMAAQTKYVVFVDKGLKGAKLGVTPAAFSTTFTTVAPPSVARTFPINGDGNAGRFGISIQFATPMDPDTLDGKVSVSGFTDKDLEGHLFTSEGGVSVNVSLKPSTSYTVSLAAGATDRYGQPMGAFRFTFTTGAQPSTVQLALPGFQPTVTYSSTGDQILYFQTTNQPSVGFTLYPLSPDDGRRILHDFGRQAGQNYAPPLPPIRTWTETVSGPKDELVLGQTSLGGGQPLRKGYYFLRTSGGQFASQFAFVVVDTVLVTKLSNDELLAWALDHDTGKPLAGVTVRATGPITGATEAVTDANGLASFKVPGLIIGTNLDRSYVLWIDDGGRTAMHTTRWQLGTSPFQFGLPGEFYEREFVGQIYTDRPLYRPGETVEYKAIVRTDDDARYTVPAQDPKMQLVLRNARGQEIKREDVKLSEFGSFAGRFEIPLDAPLGDYFLSIGQKRANFDYSFAGNSFLVAQFRKPEFLVDVSANKTSYVDGESIDAKTTATFLFGGAVAGAPVNWTVLGEPFAIRPKGYESYSFADIDFARQAVFRDAVRAKGTATTNANGVAAFTVPASLAAGDGAQRFTVSANVTDINGQGVAGSTQVTVHPAELYAGIRPAGFVATEGRDATLRVVTVDTDGNALAQRAVVIRIYDRQWITTKELVPGGGKRYKSEAKDTLLTTLRATTDAKGEGSVTYRPTQAGSIRAVAEVTDARGRTARSATYLWVSGTGYAAWQFTNDDAIKLVADKDRYEVGDTAEVLVPAPFAGMTALVSVERGKIMTRSVQTMATNSERLRIPITDRSVPDVFVSVVLYRAPTAEDKVPRYKVGYVQLPVSTATRVLTVSVKPDRDQAKPGDKVHYDIKVTDKDGRGVKAEVSAAVVDKAILALADERGPDGLHAFWFERGLSINTSSSMAVSADRWNDVIAEAVRQGKGGSGAPGSERKEFKNTAFWTAQLVTKDDGTASVDVTMPDDLTTWRMQVRAISGNTMVGEGTNELLSTKPLLVRPALPRFVRVGDSVDLRALVTNSTKTATDVNVTVKADGVTVTGVTTKSANVPAGGTVGLVWPAKVLTEGTVRVTFSGGGTGLEDSVAIELPAIADLTQETMSTGGIVTNEAGLEAIYLPPFADRAHGTLAVQVRSALVGSMADELYNLRPIDQEGAERVASRLIATLGVRRAEKSAGVTATTSDSRITSDLASLIGRQRPDGGWAWCDQTYCQSDPNVTGWVLLALGEARRDKLVFDTGAVSRASVYVYGWVNRSTDVTKPADTGQKAFMLAALLAAGQSNAITPAHALFEQSRARLANWGRAYLVIGLNDAATAPNVDAQAKILLDDLAAATIPSANGNHWEDATDARGSFMTSAATTSLVALALGRVAPEHALLPQTVRWLVLARAAQGWQTNIERAMGILALSTYAVSTGELAGDYSYKVTLDDRQLLAGLVKPTTGAPSAAQTKVPLTTVPSGKQSILAVTRDYARPGRLYYTLDLRYATPAKEVEALNRGFAVSHEYTTIDDPARAITTAKLGDVVRVKLTVIAPTDHSYVVVQDMLPAGLEAVDARLKNVDPGLKAKLEAERIKSAQAKGGGFFAPWFRWYYSPWQQVELRDDRAVLATDRLSKGVYEYIYYARATTTGDFFVAPAHAEETYFPEVFGRSDSGRFTVAQ